MLQTLLLFSTPGKTVWLKDNSLNRLEQHTFTVTCATSRIQRFPSALVPLSGRRHEMMQLQLHLEGIPQHPLAHRALRNFTTGLGFCSLPQQEHIPGRRCSFSLVPRRRRHLKKGQTQLQTTGRSVARQKLLWL